MAYIQTVDPTRRIATIGAVGLLHAAAIYAIVTGLSFAFIRMPDPPPISATNHALPTALPSPDKPVIRPSDEPVARPIDVPNLLGETITLIPLTPVTSDWPLDPLPTGAAEPIIPRIAAGTVAPRVARPRGVPGNWVTPDDFPARDLREGHAGSVGFRLAIGVDGRVTGCTVTRSSGFAGLDTATCRLLSDRARFDPATNDRGEPTTGNYASAVRWEIPD